MKTCPHIYLCLCHSCEKRSINLQFEGPYTGIHLPNSALYSTGRVSQAQNMFVWRPPPPQKKWILLNTLIQLILLHFWVLNVAFISFHTWLIQLLTVGHLICSDRHLIVFWSCLSTKETLKVRLGPKINHISPKVKQENTNYRAACWGTNVVQRPTRAGLFPCICDAAKGQILI